MGVVQLPVARGDREQRGAPKGDDLEVLIDADSDNDKTYTGMGVAKTLSMVGY